jgi:hypothetical protein
MVINTNKLMLYREIIAVSSEIHAKCINSMCELYIEFFNIALDGKL